MKKLRKMKKKGAIEMSINTIVILLLALAMLGVGMFVINMLRESVTELDVSQQKKDQIYNKLDSSGSKFLISAKEISVKSTETYRAYYGLENVLDSTQTFEIIIECEEGIEGGLGEDIDINFRASVTLNSGERTVEVFEIDPSSAATDVYACKITVEDSDGSEYASERFNLEVVP
jgi:hypothetical protein